MIFDQNQVQVTVPKLEKFPKAKMFFEVTVIVTLNHKSPIGLTLNRHTLEVYIRCNAHVIEWTRKNNTSPALAFSVVQA